MTASASASAAADDAASASDADTFACCGIFLASCRVVCIMSYVICQDLIQRSLGATKEDLQREQQARKQLEAKSERDRTHAARHS